MDLVAEYGSSSDNDSSNDDEEMPQPIKKKKLEKVDKLKSLYKLSDIKQRIANLEAEEAELIEESSIEKFSKVKTNAKTLLQKLPEPSNTKEKEIKTNNSLIFVPRKIKKEKEVKDTIVVDEEIKDDSEDSNEGYTNMFGMSSLSLPSSSYEEIETKPVLEIFMDNNISGPCRPTPTISENTIEDENESNTTPGTITKEQANELIYRHELAQWGISREAAARVETHITDVNVDSSLGPNIESTIRANMHYGNAALIVNASKVNPKNPINKLAKQKHQITYLADLAMKNEEKLKEQWASNKSKRKLAAQRYGFK
ncbi:Proline-rich protein PRCC family-containing protein [Strongyloides ratti]|uniref:Proline-rich protein PRCC family-containing protein n=1 Tax=Strongyloides ratti TaxID=34506 RepID=A0A090LDB2_STRRB|nr:Proline-rich protein PRCC family-containing protein [Strongyloides ratti]CEF65515.1 Proline-rich protein PRCC family-containing protein [Strongyloides ratti]